MGALDWIKRPHGLKVIDSRLPRPVVLYEVVRWKPKVRYLGDRRRLRMVNLRVCIDYLQIRESRSARLLSAGLVSMRRSFASFRRLRLIFCLVAILVAPRVEART